MPTEKDLPSTLDVRSRVATAICDLFRHDRELLGVTANERSITHKLAEHLQRQFPYWHVDCEYNRDGLDRKTLNLPIDGGRVDELEAKTVFPDIVVHRRGERENLLVIEFKKSNGSRETHDLEKLRAFTSPESFAYRHGLFLRLGDTGCRTADHFVGGGKSDSWASEFSSRLKEAGYEF